MGKAVAANVMVTRRLGDPGTAGYGTRGRTARARTAFPSVSAAREHIDQLRSLFTSRGPDASGVVIATGPDGGYKYRLLASTRDLFMLSREDIPYRAESYEETVYEVERSDRPQTDPILPVSAVEVEGFGERRRLYLYEPPFGAGAILFTQKILKNPLGEAFAIALLAHTQADEAAGEPSLTDNRGVKLVTPPIFRPGFATDNPNVADGWAYWYGGKPRDKHGNDLRMARQSFDFLPTLTHPAGGGYPLDVASLT